MTDEMRRTSARQRADATAPLRCKPLIAVIEHPTETRNIGTVIRNVPALGAEKTYVVDPARSLPGDWQQMRTCRSLSKTAVSAVKRRFDSTAEGLTHPARKNVTSIVTSPHVQGKRKSVLGTDV